MSNKEIWGKLSAHHTENVLKKGNFNYLSWTHAYAYMMDNYPHSEYTIHEPVYYKDDSVMVHCTIKIGEMSRYMWLAVMNYSNKAITNPTSVDINKSQMRCFVKCIAMFGLGLHIYAGEDIPMNEDEEGDDEDNSVDVQVAKEETREEPSEAKSKSDKADAYAQKCISEIKNLNSMSSLVAWKQKNLKHLDDFKEAWEFQHSDIGEAYNKHFEKYKNIMNN
tara:strand:- start:4788 stop:5450 length:663 start_codon:yes stop_codon:yes gene_type:complete